MTHGKLARDRTGRVTATISVPTRAEATLEVLPAGRALANLQVESHEDL